MSIEDRAGAVPAHEELKFEGEAHIDVRTGGESTGLRNPGRGRREVEKQGKASRVLGTQNQVLRIPLKGDLKCRHRFHCWVMEIQ